MLKLPKPNRFVFAAFQIDTNRINARQQIESMNQLEKWARDKVILLDMSEPAFREALNGNNWQRVQKTITYMFAQPAITAQQEQHLVSQIEQILFPGGAKTSNERNDVLAAFTAKKYQRTLVTKDGGSKSQPGGILGNAAALASLGITVASDTEAVCFVRAKIARRDADALHYCNITGEPLPHWVGVD
jgi:hypothetical protein